MTCRHAGKPESGGNLRCLFFIGFGNQMLTKGGYLKNMADDGILFAKILRQFARSSAAINPAPEDKVSLHQSKFVFQIILIL